MSSRSIAVLAAGATLLLAGSSCVTERPGSEIQPAGRLSTVRIELTGIMDTDASLQAVVAAGNEEIGRKALAAAEAALRDVETRMNAHDASSELARLNAAPPNAEVPLSPPTLEALRLARHYAAPTDGAFDVTCRPLLNLWRQAGCNDRLPSKEELREAMTKIGWRHFKLLDRSAVRLTEGASIDLGGIAKKYGIDRAADAMIRAGGPDLLGGLINVGGDVRCFGRRPEEGPWQVGIRDPFARDGRFLAVLNAPCAAVCTSGNYERFVIIRNKRYSHIVDPRTGLTADAVPLVAVVGRDAVSAGVWATALSVLGPAGLDRLPDDAGLEVLLVTGSASSYEMHMTPGMADMLQSLLPGAQDKPAVPILPEQNRITTPKP